MSASDYLELKLLDHTLGNTAFTQPSSLYVALYTVAPTDAGGGTEVSGSGYARTLVTFGAASSGSAASNSVAQFPVSTAGWGTVTHYGIFDAATSGNLLVWEALSSSKVVLIDESLSFAIGNLTVTVD
jgi:hypothetical protein